MSLFQINPMHIRLFIDCATGIVLTLYLYYVATTAPDRSLVSLTYKNLIKQVLLNLWHFKYPCNPAL
ncbi:hypothetical protein HBA_0731 [Sodalis endosymbiont of Henestaris halophilus]|nr:hypothetical protein HBA_0731 [Sodalis endosymbiont of Henestaris halophilus]